MASLTQAQKDKIAEAVAQAERKTSGELVSVIVPASDTYVFAAYVWPTLVALMVSPLALLLSPDAELLSVIGLQAGILMVLGLALLWMPARMIVVPKAIQQKRSAMMARLQFLEQNVHMTGEHTGVLIFVSLAERYVEILADKGINDKVGNGAWAEEVARFQQAVESGNLADGLVQLVNACGEILAEHCPVSPDDQNELSNSPVDLT